MNNVNQNENPVRAANNLPLRTPYIVPSIQWVPNSNSTPNTQKSSGNGSGDKAVGLGKSYK